MRTSKALRSIGLVAAIAFFLATARLKAKAQSPTDYATSGTPDLKTTVAFMNRMVATEHRQILLGDITGLKPMAGTIIVVVSPGVKGVVPDDISHKSGFPELTYRAASDCGKAQSGEQTESGCYVRFSLGSIDPTSIQSKPGPYDLNAAPAFWAKYPSKCQDDDQCLAEWKAFFDTVPELTTVEFHTTDLNPAIDRGHFKPRQTCSHDEEIWKQSGSCGFDPVPDAPAASTFIYFRDKDRAERFVTALRHAVKLSGGQPDLFPPTPESGKSSH